MYREKLVCQKMCEVCFGIRYKKRRRKEQYKQYSSCEDYKRWSSSHTKKQQPINQKPFNKKPWSHEVIKPYEKQLFIIDKEHNRQRAYICRWNFYTSMKMLWNIMTANGKRMDTVTMFIKRTEKS